MEAESSKNAGHRGKPTRRWKRWFRRGLLGACATGLLLGTAGWFYLRASLPIVDGELQLNGLRDMVRIDRDAMGVPTIEHSNRMDSAFALGFIHAQDRFFQMDLLRRLSAGRLSELFGKLAVGSDAAFRKHRFSKLAKEVVLGLPDQHRQILRSYSEGVNCGLDELSARPFEYAILGQTPNPWEPEDAILVMMTMLCDLQPKDGDLELRFGELQETVPGEVFEFLVRDHSRWDAPLDGTSVSAPAIPGEEVFALREVWNHPRMQLKVVDSEPNVARDKYPWMFANTEQDSEFLIGSNSWAVSGERNNEKRAILASDMHLGLRVPTIWYRAELKGPTVDGENRRLIGVTLPGTPVLIEGSNGTVAWGFTNSYGDYGDVVELVPGDVAEDGRETYVTTQGHLPIEVIREEIQFPGGSEVVEYEWTVWGPVVDVRNGRRFVHHWVGHDPQAFDLNLLRFEGANSVEDLLDIANRTGMPHQNVTVIDSQGNIGWTLSGRIPRRPSSPSKVPVDWSTGEGEWSGYLEPSDYPRIVNPEGGRIWAANNRILGGEYLDVVGNGGFDIGARAMQIRDRLLEKDVFSEEDLLAIQLDDEARFLAVWKDRFLNATDGTEGIVSEKCRRTVFETSDRASVDSVGYRIVRLFRDEVLKRIFEGAGREDDGRGQSHALDEHRLVERLRISLATRCAFEDVATELLEARPQHWLPAEYGTWDELVQKAASTAERKLTKDTPLETASWGARNRASIRHPLSNALSFVSGWLDMPSVPLPGDNHMPRVQSPSGGASQRMVVSPGHEEKGYYHQPGGQSGHPLSPYYAKGFEQWVEGARSALLPGEPVHSLIMEPKQQK